MNISKSWLALLLIHTVLQTNSNGFASSAHWNRHSHRLGNTGIGKSGRKTPSWGGSVSSRTAFIQTEDTSKTNIQAGSSKDEEATQEMGREALIEKSHSAVKGGAIQVSAAIELPFPKYVAYDAFSDLSRQSSYSPWLKSVEYIEGERNSVGSKTRWRLAYLGLRFTWNAISTLQDPKNGIIEWESITGLQNNGRVTFHELEEDRTYMNMTMSFAFPRIAARLIGPQKLASIVERRILETTVRNFRQTVVENDWKVIQEQRQQHQQQKHAPNASVANTALTSPHITSSAGEAIRK